jgi:hypothetical protein
MTSMRSESGAVQSGVFAREIVTPLSAYAMANIVFTLAPVLVGDEAARIAVQGLDKNALPRDLRLDVAVGRA